MILYISSLDCTPPIVLDNVFQTFLKSAVSLNPNLLFTVLPFSILFKLFKIKITSLEAKSYKDFLKLLKSGSKLSAVSAGTPSSLTSSSLTTSSLK